MTQESPNVPTNQTIGARARLARAQANLRQEDVAAYLDIPRPSVAEIERGRRELSSRELSQLSALLGKPVAWFLATEPEFKADAWDPAAFRLRGGDLSDGDRRALLAFASRCYDYANLERVLGITSRAQAPRYRVSAGRHIDQGRETALHERSRLRLGTQPIADVVAVLEQEGIKVLDWSMPDDSRIDGALFVSDETGPCILLNEQQLWVRRQFTAAHEFGHLVMDADDEHSDICFSGSRSLPEKRANAFAAEFLSPTGGVDQFLATLGVTKPEDLALGDVVELQRYFHLSFQATVWRLLNLEWIDDHQREWLLQFKPSDLQKRLGYTSSKEDQRKSASGRFRELALRAWREGRITLKRLAELLDIRTQSLIRDLDSLQETSVRTIA